MLKLHCLHKRVVFILSIPILSIFILGSIGQYFIPQVQAIITPLCRTNTCITTQTFNGLNVDTNITQTIASGITTMNQGALHPITGILKIKMTGGATASGKHPGLILNGTRIFNTQFIIGNVGGISNQLQINGTSTNQFSLKHMVDIAGGILDIEPGSGKTATFTISGATYTDVKSFINIKDNTNSNTITIGTGSTFIFKDDIRAIPSFIGFDDTGAARKSKGQITIEPGVVISYDPTLTLNKSVIDLSSTGTSVPWILTLKSSTAHGITITANTDNANSIIKLTQATLVTKSVNNTKNITLHNLGAGSALYVGTNGFLDVNQFSTDLQLISDNGDGLVVQDGKVEINKNFNHLSTQFIIFNIQAPNGIGLHISGATTSFDEGNSYLTIIAKHPVVIEGGTVTLKIYDNTTLRGTQTPTDDVIKVSGGNVMLYYGNSINYSYPWVSGTYVHMTGGTVDMPSLENLVGMEHALVVEGGTFTHDSIGTPYNYTTFHGINGSAVRITGGDATFEGSSYFISDNGVGAEFLGGNITFKSSSGRQIIGFYGKTRGLVVSNTTVTFPEFINIVGIEGLDISLDISKGGHVISKAAGMTPIYGPNIFIRISKGGELNLEGSYDPNNPDFYPSLLGYQAGVVIDNGKYKYGKNAIVLNGSSRFVSKCVIL